MLAILAHAGIQLCEEFWISIHKHFHSGLGKYIFKNCLIAARAEMSISKAAPQQFKQPSRKGKKAWRKNVDITDVQSGLERLREEIIQG